MTNFDEDLNNLIFEREKLNADLTKELQRSHLLSKATRSLRALNDEAEAVVAETLQSLGFNPVVPEEDYEPIAQRFAPPLRSEEFAHAIFNQADRLQ